MTKCDMGLRDIPVALCLLTRFPIPVLPDSWFERKASVAWTFPIVGFLIALPAVAVAFCADYLGLPEAISAGLTLGLMILTTGAMHEDGLADTADGFWGGFTPARRLEIMRDSQIGTYGVVALCLSLGLRWSALAALVNTGDIWVLLPVAMLSRAAMPAMMVSLPNARTDGLSQQVGTPRRRHAIVALVLAGFCGLIMLGVLKTLLCAAALALVIILLRRLALAKIGGRTGDVLGASQQLCELGCLLTLLTL